MSMLTSQVLYQPGEAEKGQGRLSGWRECTFGAACAVLAQDTEDVQAIAVVVDALKQLQAIAHTVFDRVEARVRAAGADCGACSATTPAHWRVQVDAEHARLQQLKHKVANCEHKVGQLRGTKAAVQVISSSKYPIEEGACRSETRGAAAAHGTPPLQPRPASTPCMTAWTT